MQIEDLPSIDWAFVDQLRAQTRAWLTGKRDASPDDAAFEAAQLANPPTPPLPYLPRALEARVVAYQEERTDLQNTLTAWLKKQPNSAAAAKTFAEENAERIAALERSREQIRAELAALAARQRGQTTKGLDALIREFSGSGGRKN